MDKKRLMDFFKKQDPSTLIQLLEEAFDEMTTAQRRNVFGGLKAAEKPSAVEEKSLLKKVKKFQEDSLKGIYYAPFAINSKNFMDIPEETEEWFEKLAELLGDATKGSEKGNHKLVVECFKILYELIDKMEDGEEIVFADELGSWMIPGGEKTSIKTYLHSLSAVTSPEEFTDAAIPLLKRDSCQSFSGKVYKTAVQAANKEQKKALDATIKSLKIRVK